MTEQEEHRRKSRRDLLLVLLILPLGVLCMFVTGQVAIKLAPTWVLHADMSSYLDPNANFEALGDLPLFEPLNSDILTKPAWGNLFLTPQAFIPNRVIATKTPVPVNTAPPPPVAIINTPVEPPEATATQPIAIIIPTHGGPARADLSIEKSDNSPTYTPGTAINYTILVTDLGPDDATTVDVIDTVPAAITGLTVNCTPAAHCGTNTSTGNNISYTGASLVIGGVNQITISISGTVASGATGDLSNTARVVVPDNARYSDPYPSNNTATDTDTQHSVYDLAIAKTDGVDTYTTAAPLIYTVLVTNDNGPSDALGVSVTDNLPLQIASWTWVCSNVINASGCDGITSSTSNFTDTVNIQVGGRIEYTVTANPALLPPNPQNLTNTVSVLLPGGPIYNDPNLANNTATDVDIPWIDLQITKDDGTLVYSPPGPLTYTVTVINNSSFNLTGIPISDRIPPLITSWSWSCTGGCTPVTNSNTDFTDSINLLAGSSLVYTVTANINAGAVDPLENTAMVGLPTGLVDAVPGNNTATDTDVLDISDPIPPEIGTSPDGNIYALRSGSTLTLNIPTVVNGHAGPDLVYYEYVNVSDGEVYLDWIEVQIGDGTNWYTVFYWGDENPDLNSNMNFNNLLPPINSPPPPPYEPDQRHIQAADLTLFPPSGVSIDLDGYAPPGVYPFLRFIAPTGDMDGQLEIDAVLTLP
jgi:uncharacterized repeat protein (TIGR01451 family)